MTGLRYLTVLAAAAGLAAASAALDDQSPNPDRHHVRDFALLQKRETCGPGIGNCPAGQCCSQYNWCGTTDQHCGGGCQSQYGTCGSGGNGGNTGGNTGGNFNGIPRPQFGSVPYGVTLTSCSTPGTIAITFDDGPYIYTNQLLDLLASTGVKSTFFINGNNYADTSQAPYPDILRRMVADGHQIASHTFSHADLDTLDTAGRQSQMAQLENLFKGIFGSVPTYMRPPYGNCGGGCLADLAAMGYHVITWNIDTDDYDHDDPNGIQVSVDIFDSAVSGNAGSNAYISLEHDVHEWTVNTLAAHIINTAHSRGYRTVTVGECLGDPSGNWYRDGTTGNAVGGGNSGGNTGGNTGGGLTASTDGSCASNSGGRFTCQGSSFGNCCSQYGWCGSTNDYCGGGCQGGFGSCGSSGGNTGGNTGGGLSASPDGTCASNSGNKYTCLGSSFGNCCSQWGWCGSTADYCGGGCQGGFGTC